MGHLAELQPAPTPVVSWRHSPCRRTTAACVPEEHSQVPLGNWLCTEEYTHSASGCAGKVRRSSAVTEEVRLRPTTAHFWPDSRQRCTRPSGPLPVPLHSCISLAQLLRTVF